MTCDPVDALTLPRPLENGFLKVLGFIAFSYPLAL
jgi:hypothetical protein